jgi:polyisoprenoid-binding protein YceI
MKKLLTAGVLLALAACSQQNQPAQNPPAAAQEPASAPAADAKPADTNAVPPASTAPVPAGAYKLDPMHASLLFRVNHLGFSNYTARFKKFDAQLQFDPQNLGSASVTATVDPNSLETDFPDPTKVDFNAQIRSQEFLDTAKYPDIKFVSKQVDVTGPNTVRITGDFTLHGVTKPLVLEAKFNGGYAGHPFDPAARIGFSANGSLKRSDYGISYGIPAPGTTLGVSDEVQIIIEAEFNGPPLPKTAETEPQKG